MSDAKWLAISFNQHKILGESTEPFLLLNIIVKAQEKYPPEWHWFEDADIYEEDEIESIDPIHYGIAHRHLPYSIKSEI